MSTSIRRATQTDIDELSRLFDGYRMFYEQPSDIKLARAFLHERLEKRDSVIFVADSGEGALEGFTQLYPAFSSVAAQHVWILNDLYVDKNRRHQGLGRLLMNKAKEHGIETNAKRIELSTGTSNVNAQSLYESLGYQLNSEAFYYALELC